MGTVAPSAAPAVLYTSARLTHGSSHRDGRARGRGGRVDRGVRVPDTGRSGLDRLRDTPPPPRGLWRDRPNGVATGDRDGGPHPTLAPPPLPRQTELRGQGDATWRIFCVDGNLGPKGGGPHPLPSPRVCAVSGCWWPTGDARPLAGPLPSRGPASCKHHPLEAGRFWPRCTC